MEDGGKFNMVQQAIPQDNIYIREKGEMQVKRDDAKNDASKSELSTLAYAKGLSHLAKNKSKDINQM
jgi:hypothetical protein